MEKYETREYKAGVVDQLQRVNISSYELCNIDPRLHDYCMGVQSNPDDHNVDEILAVIRFFRNMDNYYFAAEPVKDIINLLEKELNFATSDGMRPIIQSPCQIFDWASIYGFYEKYYNANNGQYEFRRLVRQAIIFIPRKFGKTTMTIGAGANDLIHGEANGQTYILSNTDRQSLICFKELRRTLEDADKKNDLHFTAHNVQWRDRAFKNNPAARRTSFIEALSGNPKTKDGLNASLCIYDEYGSAFYVKDHSDGAALLSVVESSMGQRKEPLTIIITTASRVIDGPFQIMLEGAKRALRGEISADWQFAHLFHPDGWETDDQSIADPRVWAKCQPHLGYTVQPDYYAQYWNKAQLDPEAYVEFKCKLLNIFQRVNNTDWLTSEDIHRRTGTRFIDEISLNDGWECYAAMDFSKGNDLNAQVYLCHRIVRDTTGNYRHEFYADCDAWITEEQLNKATLNPLYKDWHERGYLRICKGAVINEMDILRRTQEVASHVRLIQIGYDKYDADRFVNALNAWLYGLGADPKKILTPVSQTLANFNAPVQGVEYLIKADPALIEFSPNPLFGWCFDNCVLEEDKIFENVKPIKRTQNGKIDIAICLCMCLSLYDSDDANKIILE